jgi:fucose 4-O-acetylase-like acetyltransferase
VPSQTLPANRDYRLDVARGLGILLVLYAHSLEPLFMRDDGTFTMSAFWQWRLIYSFHMPLFFALSGATRALLEARLSPTDSLRRALRDALSLVLLVVVCNLLSGFLMVWRVWRQHVNGWDFLAHKMLHSTVLLCDFPLNTLWFPTALAFTLVLAALWSLRTPLARAFVVLVCCVSLWTSLPTGATWDVTGNWFQIRQLFPALVFFLLGRALSGRYPAAWLGALALAAGPALALLNRGCPTTPWQFCPDIGDQYFGSWMILGRFGFMPIFFVSAFLGCIGVLGLSSRLPARGFAYLGRVSLPLYLINAVAVDFVLPHLTHVPIRRLGVLHYLAIFVGTLVVHLAVLYVARGPIEKLRTRCDRWAQRILDLVHPASVPAPATAAAIENRSS